MGTITKALEMLNFFSDSRPQIGLSDFVRLTGRDKATVHRHLVELEQNGFLEQHPGTRAYRLGPAILRLSAVREATYPVRSILRPVVTELAEEVGELVHASVLQGYRLSPVFHHDPMLHGTQVHFDQAEMLPLHATSSGLAVLAYAPEPFRRSILGGDLVAYTERTVTDPATLHVLLDEIHAGGVSRLSGAYDGEVTSQGVPVFGPGGSVTGALSAALPSVRATPGTLDRIAAALRAGAVRATRALGGEMPARYPLPPQTTLEAREV